MEVRIWNTPYANTVMAVVPWLYGDMNNRWSAEAWKRCDCRDTEAAGRKSTKASDSLYS